MLHAWIDPRRRAIVVRDGDEEFAMDRVEAAYYDIVEATDRELLCIEGLGYRLLGNWAKSRIKGKTACRLAALQAVDCFQRLRISRS
jgi:hypothetical protein